MSISRIFTGLLVLGLAAAAHGQGFGFGTSEPPTIDPERQIVFEDEAHLEALFIPGILFDEQSLEQMPWSNQDQARLESRLGSPFVDAARSTCPFSHQLSSLGTAPGASSISDWIGQTELAFRGQVAARVVGWSPRFDAVVEMVHVDVEEVLNGPSSTLWVGRTMAFAQRGGELRIDGRSVCTHGDPRFEKVPVGGHVLVIGDRHSADDIFVDYAIALPMEGDVVRQQPYPALLASEGTESFSSIRSAVDGSDGSADDGSDGSAGDGRKGGK